MSAAFDLLQKSRDRVDKCSEAQRAHRDRELRVAGGVDAYAAVVRAWFFHPRNDAATQRERRAGLVLALVRTLCLGSDHEFASGVPHGLVRVMIVLRRAQGLEKVAHGRRKAARLGPIQKPGGGRRGRWRAWCW